MNKEKTIKNLNNIIELLHDGYSCYKSHIENVKEPSLKNLFANLCKQREKMSKEIKAIIDKLGGKASEGGTAIGTLHKFYENLKSMITQGDPLVITK